MKIYKYIEIKRNVEHIFRRNVIVETSRAGSKGLVVNTNRQRESLFFSFTFNRRLV